MRGLSGHHILRLRGGLCITGGLFAWIALVWKAGLEFDEVTPNGDLGGRLMAWALAGTLLMIGGLTLLQIAEGQAGCEDQEDPVP